jgi:hypothetical protein
MDRGEGPALPGAADPLRQAILMAAVLDDVDVAPADDGIVLTASPPVPIAWSALAEAMTGYDPVSPAGRAHLVRWLDLARRLHDLTPDARHDRVRPVGLTPHHVLHPGGGWTCAAIEGGVLDLGIGLVGVLPHEPDTVVVAPRGLLGAIGVDRTAAWRLAVAYLERMGAVAADRLRRNPTAALRPMGDCDVLTLLGSRALRTELAEADGVGMRGIAVPMRTRGWTDPDHVDSAFARAAALATDEEQRGLDTAVLVTSNGVHISIGRHVASDFTLREVKAAGRHRRVEAGMRDVRYRST